MTTWLVAGPFRFLRDSQIDQDFLGGEAAAKPHEGDAAGQSRWQAAAFADPVLNFKERCLPLGKSAFYLSAVLVAKKDADLTLSLRHTGQARGWLDGKEAFRSDKDPFGVGPRTAEHTFALKAGQRAHCLLKLGSDGRFLSFLVQLKADGRPATAGDLMVALPLKPGAKPNPESFILPSLSLSLGRERFVQPGEKAAIAFGSDAGYPLCDGQVAAAIAIQDAKGQAVGTLNAPPTKLADLAASPAELAWTAPKDGRSPFFTLTAKVAYEGRELGVIEKRLYSPADIGQWTTDLHKRLMAAIPAKKLDRDDTAHVLLKIEKAAILQQGADLRSYAPDDIYRELEAANDWLARLEAGKGLPALEPGDHELAYLAEQDDSAQPYYLHVPPAAKEGKPLPAIVYLHGYAPWLDKSNWYEMSAGLTELADAHGYAIVTPFARSNTDFQSIGEWDVLHTLRLAQQKLKLDPDRVFLIGYSMGGSGVYTLAAHYPDLWAGGVVMCGRPRNYLWKDFDPDRIEPFKRHLLDLESGAPHAYNFLYLPFLVFQGTADVLVQPEKAYQFVDDLTKLGLKAKLVKLEGQSHWIADEVFSTPQVFEWMDAQRRVAAPRNVRLKTYSLRYNRAWWLTLDALQRAGEPAEVNATLQPGNKLEMNVRNIARLTLRPPKELCDPAAPFQVTLTPLPSREGAGGGSGPLATRTLTLPSPWQGEGRGEVAVEVTPLPAPPRKTPSLCGPIKEALNSRFLFVYGTTGDKEATDRNRALARKMQKDWFTFAKGFRAVTPDSALPDAEMARSSLILFGTPKTNAVLARMADKLPIRFTDDGYEILGKTYKASERTGLMFISPNPLAPERYIVVCDGMHYGEKLGENHKYDLLPDFIVYSDEPDYDDSNCTHVAGFFGPDWKLDPKLIWTSDGRPKPRPAMPDALKP